MVRAAHGCAGIAMTMTDLTPHDPAGSRSPQSNPVLSPPAPTEGMLDAQPGNHSEQVAAGQVQEHASQPPIPYAEPSLRDKQRSPGRYGLLFLVGLIITGAGTALVRGGVEAPWLPEFLRTLPRDYLERHDTLVAGGLIMLVGALLSGFAALRLRVLPDGLGGLPLPVPRWRRDPLAFGAGLVGLGLFAFLCFRQAGHLYQHTDIALFFAALALVAFAVDRLDRPRRASTVRFGIIDALAAITVGALTALAGSIELARWDFSWIGDELAFFGKAAEIAQGGGWNFFSLSGVYETHPVLDSVLQASVMKMAGVNVFGWRLSEVLLVAICAACVYLLGVALFGRLQGAVAGIIVGSSHYLMAFSRIGYNNVHAVFYSTLVMLMLALAWRTQRAVFVFLTGVAMGFCLYTFQSAVLTWPITAVILLLVFARRPSWSMVLAGVIMVAGFLMVVTPALLTTPLSHIIDVAVQNSRREDALTNPGLVARAGLVDSVIILWWNGKWLNHFVSGPLFDFVSGSLLAAGLVAALLGIQRRAERLVVLWFLIGLVLIGISNYVVAPSITRLLYIVPPAALLGGLAAGALRSVLRVHLGVPTRAAVLLLLLLVVPLPFLNLYQLLVVGPSVLQANSQTLILRAIQENPQRVIVEVGPTGTAFVPEILQTQPWLLSRYRHTTLEDMESPAREGLADKLPVYVVAVENDKESSEVAARLPANYKVVNWSDGINAAKLRLFVPVSETVAEAGDAGDLPRLTDPTLIAEVRLPLAAGKSLDPRDVTSDSQGNIYVASVVDNTIRKYDPSGKFLLSWGNESGKPALFNELFAVAAAEDGTIYALDTLTPGANSATVLHFDASGKPLGKPIGGVGYSSRGFSIAPNGDILVADTGFGLIHRFSSDGTRAATVGGPGSGPGQFKEPTDVVAGKLGDLYVFDASNSRIQHLGLDGSPLSQVEVSKVEARESGHLALDPNGRLFVTDPVKSQLLIYDEKGALAATWPFTSDPGSPVGVYVDKDSNVYLTFPQTSKVIKYRLRR